MVFVATIPTLSSYIAFDICFYLIVGIETRQDTLFEPGWESN